MSIDWERNFSDWAQPPSQTEQERCERVIAAIRTSISRSAKLQSRKILVFTQGSFRNRVNVRQDSDVDVGVMLYDYFLSEYPAGKGHSDFDNHEVDYYSFAQFKGELEEALVAYFGRHAVTRGNKAFDIKATSSMVEADVVPVWEFRRYWDGGSYRAGVALLPDNGNQRIENYPERLVGYWPATPQHYENGVTKNTATQRRFKGMVRILKKLRIRLNEAGSAASAAVPGYLAECGRGPRWGRGRRRQPRCRCLRSIASRKAAMASSSWCTTDTAATMSRTVSACRCSTWASASITSRRPLTLRSVSKEASCRPTSIGFMRPPPAA